MQLTIAIHLLKLPSNTCFLHFLFNDTKFKVHAHKLESNQDGSLKRLDTAKDFTGRPGLTQTPHGLGDAASTRQMLIS